jgi:hypothetical protein
MFFSRFEYHMFYVLYPFVTFLLTLPRTLGFRYYVILPNITFSVITKASIYPASTVRVKGKVVPVLN